MDQDRLATLLNVGVAVAWGAAAWACARRPLLSATMTMISVTWLVALIVPAGVLWHRALLMHLLLAGGRLWPTTWWGRCVLGTGYVASVVGWPWVWPWAAATLAAALLAAATAERRRRHVSVVRLASWRLATVLASASMALPPLLTAAGVDRDWALTILVGYGSVHGLLAILVVVGVRPRALPWSTDLAIDLGSPPREVFEEALATARGDGDEVAEEAALALAAANRLTRVLESRQADLDRTLAEVTASTRRLEAAEAVQREALRRDLEAVTLGRLHSVVRALAGLTAADDVPDPNDATARALTHVRHAVQELEAVTKGLLPPALDSGLSVALVDLAERSPVPVTFALPTADVLVGLRPDLIHCVYYVVSEALTNAAKHASAGTARVRLRVDAELELEIRDDGRGGASLNHGDGSGLANLRARAHEVGGEITIDSPPGHGTSVRLVAPVVPGRALRGSPLWSPTAGRGPGE